MTDDPRSSPIADDRPGMPRWVKVQGVLVVLLVLVVAGMAAGVVDPGLVGLGGGGHGPGSGHR